MVGSLHSLRTPYPVGAVTAEADLGLRIRGEAVQAETRLNAPSSMTMTPKSADRFLRGMHDSGVGQAQLNEKAIASSPRERWGILTS